MDFRLEVYLKHIEHVASLDQIALILHQGFNISLPFGFVTYISPQVVPSSVQFSTPAQGRQSPQHRYLHDSMAMKSRWGLSEGPCPAHTCCIFSCCSLDAIA